MPDKNVLPKRKPNRLKNFDYSTDGAYFITICTYEKQCILSTVTNCDVVGAPAALSLTEYGRIVDAAVNEVEKHYPSVCVDKYVIMPNHIHLLLTVCSERAETMTAMVAPTISTVVKQMKGYTVKQAKSPLWQKSFHDHVIRDENDYLKIWNYIDTNPDRWTEDRFYIPPAP